jgi:hypothetical protein
MDATIEKNPDQEKQENKVAPAVEGAAPATPATTPETDDQEDEDDDEDEGEGPPHPADRLESCIAEAISQSKRLGSVSNINVKGELKNNTYPLMVEAFTAILDFIDAMEEKEDQEEIQATIQQGVTEAATKMKSLVALVERNKEVISCMPDSDQKEFNDIINWAKSSLEQKV